MKQLPTLKQLEYLVALVRTNHFGRAAERCYITQSTLSAGIRDLETTLGVKVAERSNRQVLITPIGARLAERAEVLLRDAEDLAELASAEREPMTGEVRLGVIPTISPFLLPRVLPVLRERFPRLTLYLHEERTASILEHLDRGELDVGLIALPYDTGDLVVESFHEDEFLFACGRDHAMANTDVIALEALAHEPLLLLEEGHCLRGHTLDACALTQDHTRAQFEASSLHTLIQMVAGGIGVTLVPQLAVDAGITRGTGISLTRLSKPASRQLGLAWRKTSARGDDYRRLAESLRDATMPDPLLDDNR